MARSNSPRSITSQARKATAPYSNPSSPVPSEAGSPESSCSALPKSLPRFKVVFKPTNMDELINKVLNLSLSGKRASQLDKDLEELGRKLSNVVIDDDEVARLISSMSDLGLDPKKVLGSRVRASARPARPRKPVVTKINPTFAPFQAKVRFTPPTPVGWLGYANDPPWALSKQRAADPLWQRLQSTYSGANGGWSR